MACNKQQLLVFFYYSLISFSIIKNNNKDAVNLDSRNSTNKEIQKQAPPISCPRDTSPFVSNGRIKQCKPGESTSCPSGFICYFDGIEERYICCGKRLGFCETGQPYTDISSGVLQECRIGDDTRCKSPYKCETRNAGSKNGYCCLNLEAVEPPPVGCPWGTRPLKDRSQAVLSCVPGATNACPGDAICYFDSVEKTNKCCGRDPGEGCPTGTRALKINSQIVFCTPGDRTQDCSGSAVCQWSYLIDRFQCCQADNGCSLGSAPLLAVNNLPQLCQKDASNSCPAQYNCDFNFWTASYQCCGQSSGTCPLGQVAYLESGTNQIRTCNPSIVNQCPIGYTCQSSSSGQFICCGQVGQCPSGLNIVTDNLGRARTCLPNVPNQCQTPATCLAAIGGASGQFLCCSSSTSGQCPRGFTPQNGQIIVCNPGSPSNCASGSSCLQSPNQPSLFLCCSSETIGSQCPSGYQPFNNVVITCNPTSPSTCTSGSLCLPSVATPGTFLCCSQTSPLSQCPSGFNPQNNVITQCNPSSSSGVCFPPSQCMQSPSNPSFFLCCSSSATNLQCPNGFQLQNNFATTCTTSSNCVLGNSCLQSINSPGTSICCTPQSGNQCPSGSRLQNGIATPCSLFSSTCTFGSFCLSSPANLNSQICCTVDNVNTVQCPINFQLQNGQAQQCDPTRANSCTGGSTCLPSTVVSNLFICCTPGTPGAQCPNGYSLQNGQVSQCQPTASNCFAGSFCLPSPSTSNFFLCCSQTSPTLSCPSGFDLQGGSVTLCNPSQPNCIASGAQCLQSPSSSSSFLCCVGSSSQYTCPTNFRPYMVGPNYYFCTQSAPNCPMGSSCQQTTNVAGLFICCQGATDGTYQCPSPARPLLTGSVYTFCNPSAGQFCPINYNCMQATASPTTYLCCSASSLPPTCPGGSIPFSPSSNQYVFCSSSNPTCPSTSNCQIATNMVNTYVCCGSSSTINCPSNYQNYIGTNGQPIVCTGAPGMCPSPSTCQPSVNNPSVSLCCQLTNSGQFCPANQQPLYIGNQLQYCTNAASSCPSSGYTCQLSTSLNQFICCSSTNPNSDVCPTNQQPLLIGNQIQFCSSSSSTCPSVGYSCQFSSNLNQFVCCGGSSSALRCLNNAVIYQPSTTTPFICQPNSNQCPSQYDCLPSNMPNQNVCCLRSSTGSWQCVSGRLPYPNSVNPQSCNPSGSSCPIGTLCELSNFPNQYVCCNSGSRQPQCPAQWQPLLDGAAPRRCSGPSDSSCPSPYSCTASDVTSQYICCSFSSGGLRCFTGALPFLLSNGQPQVCTTSAPNCPPNFSCQSSTQPGTLICCGASAPGNVFCPDGSQPYRTGSQPFYCSASITCPATYQCLQSTVPSYQVCCLQNQPSSFCLPGQNPLMVNNQAQTCRVESPQCGTGYICQQGMSGLYYCCQEARCSSGQTLLNTNGQPRYCNPATSSCPSGSSCQQAQNLPGNFICCIQSLSQVIGISRCIGRTTYLSTGNPLACDTSPNACSSGTQCSTFTTTGSSICCVTVDVTEPTCPSGEAFKDPTTKQYHYCSATNYACPAGFVCKQMINNVVNPDKYLCCSAKKTCQFGWAPYVDRNANTPVECNPSSINACSPPGPPYKCQQSTFPGEFICCMETFIARGEEENSTIIEESTKKPLHLSSTITSKTTHMKTKKP